jgi:hypothetical protein
VVCFSYGHSRCLARDSNRSPFGMEITRTCCIPLPRVWVPLDLTQRSHFVACVESPQSQPIPRIKPTQHKSFADLWGPPRPLHIACSLSDMLFRGMPVGCWVVTVACCFEDCRLIAPLLGRGMSRCFLRVDPESARRTSRTSRLPGHLPLFHSTPELYGRI